QFEIFGHRVGSTYLPEAFFTPATGGLLVYGSPQDDIFGLSADAQGNVVITSGGKALVPIDPASGKAQLVNLNNTRSIQAFQYDGTDVFDFAGSGFQGVNVVIYGDADDDRLIL